MNRTRTVFGWAMAAALCAVIAAAFIAPSSTALAHARYARSAPADGEVVAEAPDFVDIYFSEEVARSGGLPEATVVNDTGDQVDLGAKLDDNDRKHLAIDLAPALPEGRYTVIWHTQSDEDGEEARGAFHFYIGTGPTGATSTPHPQVTGTPAPSATPAKTASPTPTGNTDSNDDGGIPAWALIAGVVAGAAAGAAGGFVAGRRRGQAA